MSGQMSPHRYGKENWAYSELKQILSIEFLNLCCQATVDCTTTFSLFYTPTVRSLLKKLSNTPSDLFKFSAVLRDLASVLSCRTHHRGWEERICQRWTLILYEAGEEEGRYLMERKIIQAEVETRKFMAKTPKLKLESVAPSSDKPVVPAVPSISGFFKDRNRPKPIVHCIRHGEVCNYFYSFTSLSLTSAPTQHINILIHSNNTSGRERPRKRLLHPRP